MSHAPPIPNANQSPYPTHEAPHAATTEAPTPSSKTGTPSAANDAVSDVVTKAGEQIGPLADKAKAFAKARPYATAALVGTIALAVFNTLRGRRA